MRPKRFRLLADRLLGYAWPKWVQPGEQVELRMHAAEPFWVTLWRYGWEKEQVADLGRFDSFGPGGDRQIVPDEDFASTGCQWNHNGYPFGPDARNVISAPDRPGFYYVHMTARSGAFFNFPLIVAPAAGEETGDVAVLASTMDWNAYNDFGGRSNYVAAGELPLEPAVNVRQISPYLRDTGGRWWSRPDDDYAPLSFDRPEPVNRIDLEETITTPMWRIGSEHVAPATWRLVGWLEREGIDADLYAENQLDSGVLDLDRYKILILDQHPEYWTRKMYDAVKAWVFERGGKLMYLGGNGLDCEVELVADGSAGIYLNGDQSYYVTNRDFTGGPFSFSPRRIERGGRFECPAALIGVRTTLTGMGTAAPYRLLDADHFAFEGTGLAEGDLFGHASLDMREDGFGASGHETDRTCEHTPAGTRMLAKGVNPHEGGGGIGLLRDGLGRRGLLDGVDQLDLQPADRRWHQSHHGQRDPPIRGGRTGRAWRQHIGRGRRADEGGVAGMTTGDSSGGVNRQRLTDMALDVTRAHLPDRHEGKRAEVVADYLAHPRIDVHVDPAHARPAERHRAHPGLAQRRRARAAAQRAPRRRLRREGLEERSGRRAGRTATCSTAARSATCTAASPR